MIPHNFKMLSARVVVADDPTGLCEAVSDLALRVEDREVTTEARRDVGHGYLDQADLGRSTAVQHATADLLACGILTEEPLAFRV